MHSVPPDKNATMHTFCASTGGSGTSRGQGSAAVKLLGLEEADPDSAQERQKAKNQNRIFTASRGLKQRRMAPTLARVDEILPGPSSLAGWKAVALAASRISSCRCFLQCAE